MSRRHCRVGKYGLQDITSAAIGVTAARELGPTCVRRTPRLLAFEQRKTKNIRKGQDGAECSECGRSGSPLMRQTSLQGDMSDAYGRLAQRADLLELFAHESRLYSGGRAHAGPLTAFLKTGAYGRSPRKRDQKNRWEAYPSAPQRGGESKRHKGDRTTAGYCREAGRTTAPTATRP